MAITVALLTHWYGVVVGCLPAHPCPKSITPEMVGLDWVCTAVHAWKFNHPLKILPARPRFHRFDYIIRFGRIEGWFNV